MGRGSMGNTEGWKAARGDHVTATPPNSLTGSSRLSGLAVLLKYRSWIQGLHQLVCCFLGPPGPTGSELHMDQAPEGGPVELVPHWFNAVLSKMALSSESFGLQSSSNLNLPPRGRSPWAGPSKPLDFPS